VHAAGFEGFLFGKEGEGLLHAVGWFFRRGRVTFSLFLHLYPLLNEVGCLDAGQSCSYPSFQLFWAGFYSNSPLG